ncbi:Adrenodoxin, mitochondrial [Perkinsus olseni]|uniref:Adrenodoxin, mitochondrial n=1 Tax=Perkinsus olseni TaxID=32597 RepID=A0A7J6MR19_PEROL|nr:Adrenodoxin, mitochondrial [Perkinsus olseni]
MLLSHLRSTLPTFLNAARRLPSLRYFSAANHVLLNFADTEGNILKTVNARLGQSLLEVAHANDIDIEAACGGQCACATCHMILPEEVFKSISEPDEEELDMLDLAAEVTETSRLGCQVTVTPEMDKTTIQLPSEAVILLMTLSFNVRAVEGLAGRFNYVYHRRGSGKRVQVWFLGDISTFAGGFKSRPSGDVRNDYRYSIDGVAWVISTLVPQDVDLILIRPHMLTDSVYAIYSNFTLVDSHGSPRWKDMQENPEIAPDGTAHLKRLLSNVLENSLDASEVSLYSFSKGCIVLSSLMKSGFAGLPLRKLTFIDPGLNEPDELFPLTRKELDAIDKSVSIEVHSTPRQTKDPERPWIEFEIKEFVDKCKLCGLQSNASTGLARLSPMCPVLEGFAHHIEHFKNIPTMGPANALDMHFDAIPAALGSAKARGYFGRWAAGLSFDTVRPPVREPHFYR